MDLRLYEAEQRAKDKSLARKIFIACIVLIFLTAATCEAQIDRSRPYTDSALKHIIRLSTSLNLVYKVERDGIKEKIYTGVKADSLQKDTYYMVVYAYFPKDMMLTTSELTIGFNGAGIEVLPATYISQEHSYVEYRVTNEQYIVFRDKKYEYINFKVNGYDLTFEDENNSDFFTKFFKEL